MIYLIIQVRDNKPEIKEFNDEAEKTEYLKTFHNGQRGVGITDNVYFIKK